MAQKQGPAYNAYLPGIGLHDPREKISPNSMPWRAIGRLQTDLGTRCTGFLISPTIVLTAAHCLWLSTPRHFIQARSVHFLVAYHAGHYLAHARGVRIIIPTAYTALDQKSAGLDRATLILDHPVAKIQDVLHIPLAMPELQRGTPLMLGGYAPPQTELLTADTHCAVLGTTQDQSGHMLLEHSCAGTHGSSGAPLLYASHQSWQVVGIQILARGMGRGGVAVALTP